jgi:hypothetical protein
MIAFNLVELRLSGAICSVLFSVVALSLDPATTGRWWPFLLFALSFWGHSAMFIEPRMPGGLFVPIHMTVAGGFAAAVAWHVSSTPLYLLGWPYGVLGAVTGLVVLWLLWHECRDARGAPAPPLEEA